MNQPFESIHGSPVGPASAESPPLELALTEGQTPSVVARIAADDSQGSRERSTTGIKGISEEAGGFSVASALRPAALADAMAALLGAEESSHPTIASPRARAASSSGRSWSSSLERPPQGITSELMEAPWRISSENGFCQNGPDGHRSGHHSRPGPMPLSMAEGGHWRRRP